MSRGGKAVLRQARGEHPAFRCPPQMQPLDHAAPPGAGKFKQSTRERSGDAERVRHSLGVKPQEVPAGNGAAKRAGIARRVKAALFVGMAGSAADPHHNLATTDKSRDQCAAAEALLLGQCECRRQQRRAGMNTGAGAGQAVELKGMGERTIGERRRRCRHTRPAGAEDMAFATRPGALGISDDDAAPRQTGAADDRRHGIGDALLRLRDDLARQILIAKCCRISRQPNRLLRHACPPEIRATS